MWLIQKKKYIYFLLLCVILPAGSESRLQISRPRARTPTRTHRINYWYAWFIFVVWTAWCCKLSLCFLKEVFTFTWLDAHPPQSEIPLKTLLFRKEKKMQMRPTLKILKPDVMFECQWSVHKSHKGYRVAYCAQHTVGSLVLSKSNTQLSSLSCKALKVLYEQTYHV